MESPKKLTETTMPQTKETKVRGYTVRRSAPKLTPEELKAKEAATHLMLADLMKEKPRDKRG